MKLYRYRKIDGHTLDAIAGNTLWFSTPASFNDPFDCNIAIDPKGSLDDWKPLIISIMRQRHPDDSQDKLERRALEFLKFAPVHTDEIRAGRVLRNTVNEVRNIAGVCCFSARSDSILLWSHYADSHKGVCLEYDTEANEGDGLKLAKQVVYADSHPDLSVAGKTVEELAYKLVTAKASDWSYEQEYRLSWKHTGAYQHSPESLSAIIFGCRCARQDIESVKKAVAISGASPRLKRAVMEDGLFMLRIENI